MSLLLYPLSCNECGSIFNSAEDLEWAEERMTSAPGPSHLEISNCPYCEHVF